MTERQHNAHIRRTRQHAHKHARLAMTERRGRAEFERWQTLDILCRWSLTWPLMR